MKRKIVVCFIMSIVLLCGCQKINRGNETPTSTSSQAEMTESNSANVTGESGELILVSPEDQYVFTFTSYEEMKQSLTDKNHPTYKEMIENADRYGEMYKRTRDGLSKQMVLFMIPYLQDSPMDLRNVTGLSNISFHTNDLYNMPWIWYNCVVNEKALRVSVAYPMILDDTRIDQCTTYREILSLIAPSAPSPNTVSQYASYARIYEQKLTLSGDEDVVAMISELKDSSNVYVMFLYKGVLVSLYADGDLLTDTFWRDFSLSYESVK